MFDIGPSELILIFVVALLVIGVIGVVTLCYVWADRKASYVNEIFLANESLGAKKVAVPKSWKKE